MPTSVLFTRHSVRGVPDLVELADGKIVKIQQFSRKPLPLYAAPVHTTSNGDISGVGWDLSKELGKLLVGDSKCKESSVQLKLPAWKRINLRADVGTLRATNTGVGVARGLGLRDIAIYSGNVDPLFDPRAFNHFELPPSNLATRIKRFEETSEEIDRTKRALEETFKAPLPSETKILPESVTGLLEIEDKLSQEPPFSRLSEIDLGIRSRNGFRIMRGIVIRQFIDNIPIFVQQTSSTMAVHILQLLEARDNHLNVLVSSDNPISSLAALLDLFFKTSDQPTQFVNANSGLLFTLDDCDRVKIEWLGLTQEGRFELNHVLGPISLQSFRRLVKSKVNPEYVKLADLDKVELRRVT